MLENDKYVAQQVIPALAGTMLKGTGCEFNLLPTLTHLAACFYAQLPKVRAGNMENIILEGEDDFYEGAVSLDGVVLSLNLEGISFEDVLIKSNLLNEDGSATEHLSRILADKAPNRPHIAGNPFERKFPYAWFQKVPSKLTVEVLDYLGHITYNNNPYMLDVYEQVINIVGEDHPMKKELWRLNALKLMIPGVGYNQEWKVDKYAGRMYETSHHGTPTAGDLGGALYEAIGADAIKDPAKAREYLLWNIEQELSSFNSYKKLREMMTEANSDPVAFVVKYYDEKGLKTWTFARVARLIVDIEYAIENGTEMPYCGYLFGLDMKCSGSQIGSLMTNDYRISAMCGLTLTKGDDIYDVARKELHKLGFPLITRNGMKDGFNPILYGQTAKGLCRVGCKKKAPELWEAMHGNCLPGEVSKDRAMVVYKCINKVLGGITNLRNTMKKYTFDWDTEELLINKPIRFYTCDGTLLAPNMVFEVNLNGEVCTEEVVNPSIKVELPSGGVYFIDELKFKTDMPNLRKHGMDGLVVTTHANDCTYAKLVGSKMSRRNVPHYLSTHDCFKTGVNDQETLLECVIEGMLDLFATEGNFATEDLPKGTDTVRLWFNGANESRIVKSTVGTSQFYRYPAVTPAKNGRPDRGRPGGFRRYHTNIPAGNLPLETLIKSLVHPMNRVDGKNAYYAG